jgi:MFS family permease
MLDLTIFRNRLFATATAAAFLNGLSRFALMFVFYYQGAQGDDPIEAGIKLAPLALGMLIASPLAGIAADRRGSRTLAASGMLVTAIGLAGMTILDVETAYWVGGVLLFVVGVGSGLCGIAAGARTLLQNTGAVVSIAFVMAVITAAIPKDVLFAIFSGVTSGLAASALDPFIHNMHTALWVLADVSVLGAIVSLMRPPHRAPEHA